MTNEKKFKYWFPYLFFILVLTYFLLKVVINHLTFSFSSAIIIFSLFGLFIFQSIYNFKFLNITLGLVGFTWTIWMSLAAYVDIIKLENLEIEWILLLLIFCISFYASFLLILSEKTLFQNYKS